jgi:hypothetical protein
MGQKGMYQHGHNDVNQRAERGKSGNLPVPLDQPCKKRIRMKITVNR